MNRFQKNIFCLFSCLIILQFSANGQAWVKKKGATFSQIGFSSISGSSKYNGKEDPILLNRNVNDITIQLYHEHGLTDQITMSVGIPYKILSTDNELRQTNFFTDTLNAGSLNALGNIELGFAYGDRINQNWVYTFKVGSTFNSSQKKELIGLRSGEDAIGIFPSINFGYSKKKIWSSFQGGYNYRSNNYSSQIRSNLQIGSKINQNLLFLLAFDLVKSMDNGDIDDGPFSHTGLYTNNLEYSSFALKAAYSPKQNPLTFWLALGGGVAGDEVIRAASFNFSLSYQIDK